MQDETANTYFTEWLSDFDEHTHVPAQAGLYGAK